MITRQDIAKKQCHPHLCQGGHAGVLVKWNQDGEVEEQRSFDYIRDGYQVTAYRETLFTI